MSIHFHTIGGDRCFGGSLEEISNRHSSGPRTPLLPDYVANEEETDLVGAVKNSLYEQLSSQISDGANLNHGGDFERGNINQVRSSEVVCHPAHHHVANKKFWPFGTYKFHEVPPNFKEANIFTGYRSPTSSLTECIKYCFKPNNEMMNVWTHFIPFVGTTLYLISLCFSDEYDFVNDSYSWPLLTYLISCCLYPFISAFAHCFDCCSARARHVMFFMDYAAISLYGFATCIAQYAYSFPAEFNGTSLKYLYIPIAFYNSCLMPVLSCESRFIEFSPYCKKFRLLGFVIPAVWGSSPIIFRLFFGNPKVNNVTPEHVRYHKMQFLTGFVSSILYGFRFPEAFLPGKFDVIGHSHQIFHVFCTISTLYQMQGIMGDYRFFKGKPRNDPTVFTFQWSLGIWLLGVLWDAVVIRCCQKRVYCFKAEELNSMLLHVPKTTCGTLPRSVGPSMVQSSSSSSSSSSSFSSSSSEISEDIDAASDTDTVYDTDAAYDNAYDTDEYDHDIVIENDMDEEPNVNDFSQKKEPNQKANAGSEAKEKGEARQKATTVRMKEVTQKSKLGVTASAPRCSLDNEIINYVKEGVKEVRDMILRRWKSCNEEKKES